jgi:putative hydroxymethylpyrimidine transport system substrate-binding protein
VSASRRRGDGRCTPVLAAVAVLACAWLAAGCGAQSHAAAGGGSVAIALDFTPNPAHAPLYLASRQGFDRHLGVRISILVPGSGPNTLQLLSAHRADIGVLDIDDLALAQERGIPVVGIAGLVQRPLSAIIARASIRRPRDLDGKRVGVSGLPSDVAFMRALINRDGGNWATVKPVTIGFAAVAQLAAGNVAAVPAFWSDEGVALRQRGVAVREFRIEQYGAPAYPEVVLVALRSTLTHRRAAIIRALAAIARGAHTAVTQPGLASAIIVAADGNGDRKLIAAQTSALAPALLPALILHPQVLARFSAFETRTGLIAKPLEISGGFDFSLAPAALALAGLPASG